jgi:hypothetical protein
MVSNSVRQRTGLSLATRSNAAGGKFRSTRYFGRVQTWSWVQDFGPANIFTRTLARKEKIIL